MTTMNKLTFNLAAAVTTFQNLRRALPITSISTSQKTAAISAISIVILTILARYFRRKKRTPSAGRNKSANRPMLSPAPLKDFHLQEDSSSRPRSPSIRSIRRQGSVLSGISSASEFGRPDYRKNLPHEPTSSFTPQQLGVMVDSEPSPPSTRAISSDPENKNLRRKKVYRKTNESKDRVWNNLSSFIF